MLCLCDSLQPLYLLNSSMKTSNFNSLVIVVFSIMCKYVGTGFRHPQRLHNVFQINPTLYLGHNTANHRRLTNMQTKAQLLNNHLASKLEVLSTILSYPSSHHQHTSSTFYQHKNRIKEIKRVVYMPDLSKQQLEISSLNYGSKSDPGSRVLDLKSTLDDQMSLSTNNYEETPPMRAALEGIHYPRVLGISGDHNSLQFGLDKLHKIIKKSSLAYEDAEYVSVFMDVLLATLQIISNNKMFDKLAWLNSLQTTPHALEKFHVLHKKSGFYAPMSFRHRKKQRKKKLYLHGKDDRSIIFLPLMRKYPFSNVVRLSSGCTGTLLTPYHVLTAAHCVHNGEHFITNLQMLKIEIPDTMGFRVYYIQKISIPKAWRRSGYLSEAARSSFDYAIVRLSIGVPGKTTFLPLSIPKLNVLNEDMNFLGFQTNTESGLYKSKCHSYYSLSYTNINLIMARCDSAVGNSGAAVFIDDPREGKRIVGVLSNTMTVATSMAYFSRYSIIMALTWDKLYEICSMMAPLAQQYGVCPDFKKIPRVSKTPLRNTVIPFFG